MFVRAIAAAAVLLASSPPRPSSGTLPITEYVLQPTGKWVVHFDDAQCLAQRDYGPPERPLFLVLKQAASGDIMQVAVAAKQRLQQAREEDGSITLDGDSPQKFSFLLFAPSGQDFRFYSTNVPLAQLRPAAKTLWIRAGGLDQAFALLQFPALLEVMGNCVTDLRKHWNLDPAAAKANLSEHAHGSLKGIISPDDYPSDALLTAETGPVKVELLVNEQGTVADCSVIETSGVAVLDAQACAAIKERAKFKPAVGKDGKPAKDGYIQEIHWQLR